MTFRSLRSGADRRIRAARDEAIRNGKVYDAEPKRDNDGKFSSGGGGGSETHEYNRESVNKAISSSKQKIGGREAKAIHSLLKGRH